MAVLKALLLLTLVACAAPAALAVKICTSPITYGIAIDESGSIGKSVFDTTVKDFVVKLLGAIYTNGNKVYINKFAQSVVPLATNINNPLTLNAIQTLVKNTVYGNGGSTAIGDAVNDLVAAKNLLSPPGVLIVLTDGDNNSGASPLVAAADAKNLGYTVVTIGVGSGTNDAVLRTMASSNALYIKVTSFDQLLGALDGIVEALCACIPVGCLGRTAPAGGCPANPTFCTNCASNSLVTSYGASANCNRCLAKDGPDGYPNCFWCVTNALTLAKAQTPLCSCCDRVDNCYNTLENALVNQKNWEMWALRCKEKFTSNTDRNNCFWCLTNALTSNPKVCTGDAADARDICKYVQPIQ